MVLMSHAAVFSICTAASHSSLLSSFIGLCAAPLFSVTTALPARGAGFRGFVLVSFHARHGIFALFALAAGRLGLSGSVLVMSTARFSRLAVCHFLAAGTICSGCGWNGGSRRLRRSGFRWSSGLSPGKCSQGKHKDNGGQSEFHNESPFRFFTVAATGY